MENTNTLVSFQSHLKKVFATSFLMLGFLSLSFAQINKIFEAESATLSGTATIVNCNNSSGGQMVKGLENGTANSVDFKKIELPKAGNYFVTLSYYSGNKRDFSYRINDNESVTNSVSASGGWCYQGGVPANFTFSENFVEGENNLLFYNSPIIDKIVIISDTTSRKASAIYISTAFGNDDNDGLTPETAFQTLAKVNSLLLLPGDSLLFKSGDIFVGELSFINESGSKDHPIVISNYGDGILPVFDGDGFLSTVHIVNSGNLHFSNIEIKNDGGPAQSGVSEELRYGIFIENGFTDGTVFENYRFKNLTFKNIYPTVEVTDDDNTGVNAHAIITSGSWGDDIHPTRFEDMLIENCLFTRTARHAVVLKAINNLVINNNLFEHVGGAGMVIANGSTNILVENNTTNYTGSKIDSRMAGRGSGIWCYRSKNLTVQYNKFMHARGIHDSYGMHIDIGNRNVVYQYNYSEDNEGGFVEILGENVNIGYRYNLSVGDGWRKRGNRYGQIFWLAGWSGDPQNPVGSDSIFIYNNSIYVRDTIAPGIWIVAQTKHSRIYNNIINVANKFGKVEIKNSPALNDFDYNIWYGNIPTTDEDGDSYRGANAITSDPLYSDEIVTDSTGFILQPESPATNCGKLISDAGVLPPHDYFDNNGGTDFYGNAVSPSVLPNIGAYNGKRDNVFAFEGFKLKSSFVIYPNPVKTDEQVTIDLSSQLNVDEITIQIIDIKGVILIEKLFRDKHNFRLETGSLKRGSYLIRLKSNGLSESKQLLVF